ncbi:hypothetical protein ACNO7T_17750 [Vibrio campbellii]
MNLKHSALKRSIFATRVFFGFTIAFVIFVSIALGIIIYKNPSNDNFKLFSVVSMGLSSIALVTAQFANINKTAQQLAHSYHKSKSGCSTLIIHNTSEVDINITSIYLHRWPLHNSTRKLIKIESNTCIEISLLDRHLDGDFVDYSLHVTSTLGKVNSTYFEPKNLYGDEMIAEVISVE